MIDWDTVVPIALVGSFFAFMALERLVPARRNQPAIRHWRKIGTLAYALTISIYALAPALLIPLVSRFHLVDLSRWGGWAAIPTVILTTFFTYWSHRTQHRFDLLWRMGHQLHHGVARVDTASAFIFHPVDTMVQVFWTVLAGALLGIDASAAALAGIAGAWIANYQHLDIDTPVWTNWLIQRPEAHMLHHEFDVHARNFGDMPVWDMLFGTYSNPARADDVRIGFEPDRARRWLAMLAMVDVNRAEGRARL